MPNPIPRTWRRVTAITFVLTAVTAAIGWAVVGTILSREARWPGEILRHEFVLGVLRAPDGLTAPAAPARIILRLGLRRVAALNGMEIRAGKYSFTVPKGTTNITFVGRFPKVPAVAGAITYAMASGVRLPAKRTHYAGEYLPPPGVTAICGFGTSVFLVPVRAASVEIPLVRSVPLAGISLRAPHLGHPYLAWSFASDRDLLRKLITTGHAGYYRGLTMKRWCLALVGAALGLHPMRKQMRMVGQALPRESRCRIIT